MTVTIPDNLRRKLEEFRDQFTDIERQLVDPETLADHRAVARLSARRKALEPLVSGLAEFDVAAGECVEWRETIAAGDDPDLVAMGKDELPAIESRMQALVESIQSRLVNADDDAIGSVIVEIRAGVGGDEAGLWAGDLLEMYQLSLIHI